ncbi:ubiquitin-conjugating enzyme, putative [Talaromyces stipitatus ATCC 10500]|uniref:Ubiquitin-conjugating enzyme, putative n=1 Tax=Talaromyces stipitatus (strain ATCC 10500 / CBS 375.48 / QM 6759 / NRRL 1006) TaxID=441959 RepID=B8M391_TALSN|nr:ubiquitin-conjugating enzyme, putative [Talaromyces stipitatus ATCC 10500]EED22263.1 ubiquitin-conjugating enzyme, putative [Talaromyces stipitatus ATCC 10500]
MASSRLPNIPSLRKQQLFLEFRSLKHAPPAGVYVSITNPTDPTHWSGVIFIRKGPYASAILRFNIKFPPTYPELPPLITFTTDIFHPLIVPLTTYTFTTGSSNEAPVSATDEERLSPGAFSLRHGFPHWFGRARRTANNSAAGSRNVSGGSIPPATVTDQEANEQTQPDAGSSSPAPGNSIPQEGAEPTAESSLQETPKAPENNPHISKAPTANPFEKKDETVHVVTLLDYIRSTFDDEAVLDSLPLDAAGNPGAWHAWKAHRSGPGTPNKRGTPQTRLPGEWNWEGVWAKRVQSGIQASQSDAALFASTPRAETDSIRFLDLDPSVLNSVKEKLIAGLKEKESE